MTDNGQSGHLVLLMAPSGSGKSVLMQHLRATLSAHLHFAVSCTTRAMRPNEKEGDVYYFLSAEAFDAKIERGEFLEWAEYGGNRYGTLKSEILAPIAAGEVVLREVELQGIKHILELLPRQQVTVIYIEAGDWETLKRRITTRAPITEAELELRYQRFLKETAAKPLADLVVENREGRVEEAKAELVAILRGIIDKTTENA